MSELHWLPLAVSTTLASIVFIIGFLIVIEVAKKRQRDIDKKNKD